MRDWALAIFLFAMLPVGLVRPFIGAMMFALISLANVHRLTWGFAFSLPWAMMFAIVTLLGIGFTRERAVGDSVRRYLPMLVYLCWMAITTLNALEPEPAAEQLASVAKIHMMCLVTLCLLVDWQRVRQLAWLSICSISFYGLKGGLFTIANGGQYIVWGPPDSAIQDNNHLAVGLVMMLPLLYWLYADAKRRWTKWLVVFAAAMSAVSIFGSHSRSAFLAIAAMSVFLVMKSRQRLAVFVFIVIGGVTVVSLMPKTYWERMETIETYQEDASAMGRINAWHTAIAIANDRLTGGGFELYTPEVFARYAPQPDNIHSSHSIYFQALGEHGWIGLMLFLSILVYVWFQCRIAIRLAAGDGPGPSQALLARMIQVSLIGLAVGGAFVNIGNWDMVYYIAVIAMGTLRSVRSSVPATHVDDAKRATYPRSAGNPTSDVVPEVR
jgi:probable O-glycosylation ligase (exosortase A-associated)